MSLKWIATALAGAALLASYPRAAERTVNWPSFRGPQASGLAVGESVPDTWDVANGMNVAWKQNVPGLAHSSPVVWGDRIFATSAVSSLAAATFKPGLYGEGTASEDRSRHRWTVYAYDTRSGRLIWERTAYEGQPREKRHIKATYANATPATDGRHVVAFFGSQGLYAYSMDGTLLWKKDLGVLNAGAYDLPEYEWGTASSPIIYKNRVIVQCDTQDDSFVLAADIETGETVWKTARKELPSWGTPTVYEPARGDGSPELITNASNFIRAYNPDTGKELWRLGWSSKITAPTPIFSGEIIVVASGRAPERPIFALRPGGRGDITPTAPNDHVLWHKVGRGPYMPTPIIHDDKLYVLGNAGIFDAYDVKSGTEIYRERIPHHGSGFSASPVLAGGRIYLSSEDGDVFVVQAGSTFKLIARNSMGEPLMATPAISDGTMYVRGQYHLFAIRSREK